MKTKILLLLGATAVTAAAQGDPERWSREFGYDDGWRVGVHPRMLADVNGDGRDDVVLYGTDAFWVALSTGTGFRNAVLVHRQFGSTQGWNETHHLRTMADVNGDNKADMVAFGAIGVHVSLSQTGVNATRPSFSAPTVWTTDFAGVTGWTATRHPRFLGDINNDNRADIIACGDQGAYFALSTGSSFGAAQLAVPDFGANQGWDFTNSVRTIADVNADGLSDLVGFGADGVYVSVGGSGLAPKRQWSTDFGANTGWTVRDHVRILEDYDGDGHDDIIGFGPRTYIATALSTPGFGAPFGGWARYSGAHGWTNSTVRGAADFDGDGNADLFAFDNQGLLVSNAQPPTGLSGSWLRICSMGFYNCYGGWTKTRHIRTTADVNGDGLQDVVGFYDDGVYVSVGPLTQGCRRRLKATGTCELSISMAERSRLDIDALSPSYSGALYLVIGSVSGTRPGTPLPTGAHLPLNIDFYSQVTFDFRNSPWLFNTFGTLDAQGQATAEFRAVPLLTPLIGVDLDHAVVIAPSSGQWLTSRPVQINVLP